MTELQHQQCVIKWGQQPGVRAKYPELAMLFHIPNERYCTPIQGKQLKRAGVRSGVPDLCLPVPSGRYHGLFIEMKTDTGRAGEAQRWWVQRLNAAGYFAQVCHGWEAAVSMLEWYLSLPAEAEP